MGICDNRVVTVTPDYDSDPGRWNSWESPQDVHEMVAPELRGPVLDAGCGEGRLASLLSGRIAWVGLDSSQAQLAATRDEVRAYCRHNYIPLERAEQAELPLWLTKRGVLVRARKL
jgi:SAM-dependent methyltransferase